MPFQDGVYYPYGTDAQGTRTSAGIPSLLNSPQSHPSLNSHSAPQQTMTPSSSSPPILPFKFRLRRESVDWRRINAVDVDLVVSQLDVDVLQEHISMVTFCSLEGERCQRCQSPVDLALIKLLRLAQLTVEWLLHCQEFLTLHLHASEERLVTAGKECEELQAQQKKQEEKIRTLIAELKQRKKIIRTQQSLLAPRIISNNKCSYCDKSFLNATFLQSHMQRRHPDEYEGQMQLDDERKSQIDTLKMEVTFLKEQISQQQQALDAKSAKEKEQQSMQNDLQRELERFKAEEMLRMDKKIEDSRDGIRREMEFLYSRNMQFQNEINQMAKLERAASPVRPQPETDADNHSVLQAQAIQKLEHQLKKQDKKWEARLQDIQILHESEKNELRDELTKMQLSVSEQQERSLRTQEELRRKLQEKDQTIKAQREQMRSISPSQPTKIVEVPVIVTAPTPEIKPKKVVLEEPPSAPKLDPIQELSEEEKDSSTLFEKRPADKKPVMIMEQKQKTTTSTVRRNSEFTRSMRPAVEQALLEKLDRLGVKMGQCSLAKKEMNSIMAEVQLERKDTVKGMPDYWEHRQELNDIMEQRLKGLRKASESVSELQNRTKHTAQAAQIRPRSSSLPSRATQVMSATLTKQPRTPQPAPRTKTSCLPKTSTPKAKRAAQVFTSKTPPFSSEGELNGNDSETEDEQQPKHHKYLRSRSPQSNLIQCTSIQMKTSKSSPLLSRQPPSAKQSSPSSNLKSKEQLVAMTETAITMMDNDDDSSVEELQEIDPKQLDSFKDQNRNINKRSADKGNKVDELVRKVEQQFAERTTKKPAGGVSILAERKDEVRELMHTDLEESSEWVVSSSEDGAGQDFFKPVQDSGPQRKSLDSPSTSVWGTSTGREHKSGLTGGGTSSTVKSSLISLTDLSDSDDI